MVKVSIRLATENDAALIASFGARSFRDTFGPDNQSEDMDIYIASAFTADKIKIEMSDPTAVFFLAYFNHQLCGYAKIVANKNPMDTENVKSVELERIYVAKNFNGLGIGSLLMDECLKAAEKVGYHTIWLGVWEKNNSAARFYKKWGFKRTGNKSFKLGKDIQNDYILQRPV